MKKKVLWSLLISTLLIANISLVVFATDDTSDINQVTQPSGSGNTELDGKIGEWDPGNSDQPNFDDPDLEIEGQIPEAGEYFTISVTVPVNMEFTVLPKTNSAFGSFYSPEYTIKNNGSKTITTKITSFETDTSVSIGQDEAELYIEPVIGGDGKTQMELKLTAIDNTNNYNNKDIDLYNIDSLGNEDKILFSLNENESRKVKFSADRWELPWFESDKESASSSYTIGLEFSIEN